MLARLWWKEYRIFGPVWLILVLASGLLEWVFISVGSLDSRTGGLTVNSLCWAVLYAFASGAAMFSGEREAKTLGFLDALPVPRGTLWLGKVSFTLVSTFALALVLAGMAALGTETRDPRQDYGYATLLPTFGTILIEAVAWSLLWSSMTKNPLLAGVMGVLCVYASFVVLTILSGTESLVNPVALIARVLVAGAALAVSGIIMTWKSSAKIAKVRLESTPSEPSPAAIRASSTDRSLIWQASREGWTTWLLVALVGLVVPGLLILVEARPVDGMLDAGLAVVVSLVAGVSVFGTENASGSRRFLVHHGVKPGTVWGMKLLVWGGAVGSIFGLMHGLNWTVGFPKTNLSGAVAADPLEQIALVSIGLVNAFVIGVLCGMTIYRRMTAFLVGIIVLVAVVPLQVALVRWGMVPAWSAALVPSIFLVVSRLWAADWLMEREGAGPWLRLGTWLGLPFGLLVIAYIAHRGWSVPDVGPQFLQATLSEAQSISPEDDAAAAYRKAGASITRESAFERVDGPVSSYLLGVINGGWDPEQIHVVEYWKRNQAVIDRARKASEFPRGRFEDVRRLTIGSDGSSMHRDLRAIDELLSLDARERLSRADLTGAWLDILSLFRLANQLAANTPTYSQMVLASEIHHRAVGLAFDWLASPGQTSVTTRAVLGTLEALPPLADARVMLQVEESIVERSLDLSGTELANQILMGQGGRSRTTWDLFWFARIVAAPWERERVRRIVRLISARDLGWVVVEPYQRRDFPEHQLSIEDEYFRGTTLAREISPSAAAVVSKLDREQVGRRALKQAIAVVAWRVEHDGKDPESLENLVPSLLNRLPLDPYSGKPFGYGRAEEGQPYVAPIELDPLRSTDWKIARTGQPLIYTVGPNKQNDGGRAMALTPASRARVDLLFPIP